VVIQTTGGVTSNTAPVASDDSYSVYSVETLDVWLYGVTSNDTDAELDPLSAVLVSDVSNGTLTLNSDGTLEYDPNDTFIGTDSFTYKANDGDANSNVATVYIDVLEPRPVANDDYYITIQDTVLNVDANSGVLANDFSPGGPPNAILVSQPNNGSLTLDSNGAFKYDPCAEFVGIDTFTYKASWGGYDSNIATVYLQVREPLTIIVNYSFELDGNGDQITCHTGVGIGWTSINTWVGVDVDCGAPGVCDWDCRSLGGVPDGNAACFMENNNTYLYQVLDHNIIEGTQYTLKFDATLPWNPSADIVASLFYVNASDVHVQIAANTIPLTQGGWTYNHTVSFTAGTGQPYLDRRLGIKFYAPGGGEYWIYIDNVRLDMQPAADFNRDEKVNFLDYAELATAWMSSLGQPDFNDIYDLYDDDIIDMLDLKIFTDDWLWQLVP